MDFAFSGELGVEAVATSGFAAEVKYNPATEEKSAKIYETEGLAFKSVEVGFDANATIYLGVEASIKFELLAGVISVGIGAEVGNFNRIYGDVTSTNLLDKEAISALYGYYFEGGIYYDVKFLYSVAKIKSGAISFLGGRQEKVLYTAGSQYEITYLDDATMTVSTAEQDLAINCMYKNLVTGQKVTDLVPVVDAKAIKEVSEATVGANYVEIKDGKIYLTDDGLANLSSNSKYAVTVAAGSVQATIYVNAIELTNAEVGTVTVSGLTNAQVVTAEYVGGEAIDVTFTAGESTAQFEAAKAGKVIVKVNGVVYAIYDVA
jgi:hypothetical protein